MSTIKIVVVVVVESWARMPDNEQSQQREGKLQRSISRKIILKQINVYGSLLERN